ncbi:MAG TPA: glycosyltransferase 87 family protein [Actinomycetota bacterium]|nr:glycosyltransferase 87 family protein [Actinomycetota bacterium]
MPAPTRRDLALVVAVCAVVLAFGAVGKACRGFWHHPASFACHSDVRSLYELRGMDRELFPYVNGDLVVVPDAEPPVAHDLHPLDGANEYPVLTGLLMWLPSLVSWSRDSYLLASAALLAPFGLLTAWLLGRMTGRRALLWSGSPILLLYAFHNWDLPVVAATVAGFWWWWRGRGTAAAAALGAGAALKLYPALFLVPLALDRLHAGDRRGAIRAGAVGVGTFVLVNLPIAVADPAGWAVPFRFQTLRRPNPDSLWGVMAGGLDLGPTAVNVWSTAAAAFAAGAVLWACARRARRDGVYPFLPACAALLAAFLLAAKVHSPQYAVWLVPLFVLLAVRSLWYWVFVAGNVALYVAIFTVSVWSEAARDVLVTWSIWVRTATLLALVVVFIRASDATWRDRDRGPAAAPAALVDRRRSP